MNGLIEILTNKQWMIAPDALHAYRKVIQTNLQGRISPGSFNKRKSFAAGYNSLEASDYLQTEDGDTYGVSSIARLDRPFVNVIMIAGPVTRNGGGCSYGSIEHRDMIMAAADNPHCHGHVIYLDTPGGSSNARCDYLQAIEYARSKGQPVYAFIDGLCASAGMFVAAMCDKRFYMHPRNEIGCIGTMAAFYTMKDGSHNDFTDETFHEIYDPESFDKNKWYRDIANDGDTQLLVEELAFLSAEFRDYVKSRCPNVEEEHLHGKIFSAEEVKGILVDEQSTFEEVIAICFETGAANMQTVSAPEGDGNGSENRYQNVAVACGVAALAVDSEGTFLTIDLLAALSQRLKDDEITIGELTTARDEALALRDVDEKGHQREIETLNLSHSEEIAKINEQHAVEKDTLKVQLDEASQKIADRDATIADLTNEASRTSDVSPANNGTGATAPVIATMPAYDSTLSPLENQRIRNEWKRKHNI